MSVFSMKVDIAQNRFSTVKRLHFSHAQKRKRPVPSTKITGYQPTPLCSLDELAQLLALIKF